MRSQILGVDNVYQKTTITAQEHTAPVKVTMFGVTHLGRAAARLATWEGRPDLVGLAAATVVPARGTGARATHLGMAEAMASQNPESGEFPRMLLLSEA